MMLMNVEMSKQFDASTIMYMEMAMNTATKMGMQMETGM